MKQILLITLTTFLITTCAISQVNNSNHSLLAQKNKRHHAFYETEKINVKYKDVDVVKDYRGILKGFINDGIYMSSFKKTDTVLQYISIESIVSVTKLLRKERIVSGVITGVSLAATLVFLTAGNSTEGSGYTLIFAVLSGAGAAYGVIAFLSTYGLQPLNTKSVKRGWRFSIQ